jgi:hypothetical protein
MRARAGARLTLRPRSERALRDEEEEEVWRGERRLRSGRLDCQQRQCGEPQQVKRRRSPALRTCR